MMKHEFEKLIGRQIPNGVYLHIEEAYVNSVKDKLGFAEEWTSDRIDSLVCQKYFEMEMNVIEAEGKTDGYQSTIQQWQDRAIKNSERILALRSKNDELWKDIYKKDEQIKNMENEIQNLKAKLYDKNIKKGA